MKKLKRFPWAILHPVRAYTWVTRGLYIQWLRWQGMDIGNGVVIRKPFHYRHPEHIRIEDGAVIGEYAFLVAGPKSKIIIGRDVLLAPNVHINTTEHRYSETSVPIKYQGSVEGTVFIDDDCWLGTGVTVLRGVTMMCGTVVGANSVVKENTERHSVMAGSPAKYIRKRYE